MNGGSQEYVTWVKEQVKFVDPEKPPETINAQDSEDNIKTDKKQKHKS